MINLRVTIPLLIGVMILTFCVIQPRIFRAEAVQPDARDDAAYVEVLVAPGDTVWNLARVHGPRGADVRRVVYAIKEANGLESFVIHPGQLLMIPSK